MAWEREIKGNARRYVWEDQREKNKSRKINKVELHRFLKVKMENLTLSQKEVEPVKTLKRG